jgi:hypothetical protein
MREKSKKQSLIFVLAVLLFSSLLKGQEVKKQTGKKFYNEKEGKEGKQMMFIMYISLL